MSKKKFFNEIIGSKFNSNRNNFFIKLIMLIFNALPIELDKIFNFSKKIFLRFFKFTVAEDKIDTKMLFKVKEVTKIFDKISKKK